MVFALHLLMQEEAVLCALRIQRHLEAHPVATPTGDLQIRIGLHTGIAGPTGDDYIASTVDKAARVQSKAGGGEVFVSQQTQVLVSDRTQGVRFEPRGTFDLKGLQSEELYEAKPHPDLVLPAVSAASLANRPGQAQAVQAGGPPHKVRGVRSNPLKLGILAAALTLFCVAGLFFARRLAPELRYFLPVVTGTEAFTFCRQWAITTARLPSRSQSATAMNSKRSMRPRTEHTNGWSTER
jgi:hypothetical protein